MSLKNAPTVHVMWPRTARFSYTVNFPPLMLRIIILSSWLLAIKDLLASLGVLPLNSRMKKNLTKAKISCPVIPVSGLVGGSVAL